MTPTCYGLSTRRLRQPDKGRFELPYGPRALNPIDWKTVQGLMRDEIPLTLPAGVGSDVSGVVDQVGPGVSKFAVGDAVLGSSVTPSFAEYALAEPATLLRKPHGIAGRWRDRLLEPGAPHTPC